MPVIEGEVAPGYEAVAEAFERCFTELGETGASACVYVDGRAVVDLWGGIADSASGRAWERDTLVNVYSVSKPFAATCLLMLIDRGLV
ncbi:MAG TPA: serine hydrolase domain-containing protein, partial [Tepidiformaceae bacterium]|nr:serine hydrolase domain-containing protein [Tepidiformaceae bacterium]